MQQFASALVAWHQRHGRHALPWQGTRDPYRVWLSEVMLQQTQVATVVPYYERFLARFPTVRALAAAREDEVLRLWSGLGYYARGRHLHAAARQIAALREFPRTAAEIAELPGVGRSSAAAIAAFAFGERGAILDGNVKRVLSRCFGIEGWPGEKAVEARLWTLAERLLPRRGIEAYTQAVMDLGATVCTLRNPACGGCPVTRRCVARREGRAHELPRPRPRKALPLKTARWLVLRTGDRVLLERRPAKGLWGGLLVFPAAKGQTGKRLPAFEHGFTHFRLRISPLLCDVTSPTRAPRGCVWIKVEAAKKGAVPAPVRALLGRLPAPR
ncbi:MAG: A/G-specific adenine glycosylase [Betaproteobacteria bacterium]